MSSTSLKKRTSLSGGGNVASSRAPAGGGLVATALGFAGSVPDEVARKVNKKKLTSSDSPMLFFFSFSLSPPTLIFATPTLQISKKQQEAERRERSRQSRRAGERY